MPFAVLETAGSVRGRNGRCGGVLLHGDRFVTGLCAEDVCERCRTAVPARLPGPGYGNEDVGTRRACSAQVP